MLGSLIKRELTQVLGRSSDDIFVLSIMPCTAKKFEAARPEFSNRGRPDVDAVITTQEFAQMMQETGLDLLYRLIDHIDNSRSGYLVDIYPTFCHEVCDKGPTMRLNDEILERCTFEKIVGRLDRELARLETGAANKAGTKVDEL